MGEFHHSSGITTTFSLPGDYDKKFPMKKKKTFPNLLQQHLCIFLALATI